MFNFHGYQKCAIYESDSAGLTIFLSTSLHICSICSISRGFALGRTGNDNTATLALGTPGKNLTFVIAEKRSACKQRARFFLP